MNVTHYPVTDMTAPAAFRLSPEALAEALATTDLAVRLARVYRETLRRAELARLTTPQSDLEDGHGER